MNQVFTNETEAVTEPAQISLADRAVQCESAAEYVTDTLTLISDYLENTNVIPTLNEICEVWLLAPYVDLSDEQSKAHIRGIFQLTTFLVQLRSTFEALTVEANA